MKERIVVICPGRGSYTKETLGVLKRHSSFLGEHLAYFDQRRQELGQPSLSELDSAASFQPSVHTKGEHASGLIYACSLADFLAIDQERFEVVAVTGNSMGWYIALALAGALHPQQAFEVINTMGGMMKEKIIGAQLIYPIINEKWQIDPERVQLVTQTLKKIHGHSNCEAYMSIWLGGYAVIGCNSEALPLLMKALPKIENYPFQLINHAAFHTPLLKETSLRAFDLLPEIWFSRPRLPLVDGSGKIWHRWNTDTDQLYRYTFDQQVITPYNFTQAISVAIKEFAPDRLVLLGPGNSLGGAVGQILIQNRWLNLNSKEDFSELQRQEPFLISMGVEEQRSKVV